jgi:hypothetical protein
MVQPIIEGRVRARETVRAFAASKDVELTRLLTQVKDRAAPIGRSSPQVNHGEGQ